jgi:hypothetical protein
MSLLVGGQMIDVPVVDLAFRPWEGSPPVNSFGGKPWVDFDGEPVFAELAIQRLALKSGWSARWLEVYGAPKKLPYALSDWQGEIRGFRAQRQHEVDEPAVLAWLKKIGTEDGGRHSGVWDVVAWAGERVVFIESKRAKKDAIRPTQVRWLEAAMAAGLEVESLLIAEWRF